mmetsp:Transcript_15393/g.36725  ORF Transcript_15393/g.36725 Transcript_15393/m.36725 type:complete len:158 (+) Transcript_15393:41-514(+)|eukprot:CAMPEP_0185816502 /NCGR_PEP_ID=MMETSP1322-20130828/17550_1 /TAXON_ID=265543 /ORGANISM="Minutocellus polymorphus, Strain RCC2270" /LENGTH=157 /DNA_ID=CAMNT_0028513451 /DNA_START=18 /DNA_END=491 /DNA_ORIENTATION=+
MASKDSVGKYLEAASLLGLGVASGFTFYISKVEIPSRKEDTGAYCLANWQHVFPPSAAFMRPFGLFLNALMGGAIYATKKPLWWVPFACIGALGPYTKFCIQETNDELMGMKPGFLYTPDDDARAKDIVEKWGKLHSVRAGMCLIGFASAIVAALEL